MPLGIYCQSSSVHPSLKVRIWFSLSFFFFFLNILLLLLLLLAADGRNFCLLMQNIFKISKLMSGCVIYCIELVPLTDAPWWWPHPHLFKPTNSTSIGKRKLIVEIVEAMIAAEKAGHLLPVR
jgi:hypothetical protein